MEVTQMASGPSLSVIRAIHTRMLCYRDGHLIPEQLLSNCWAGSGYRAQTAVKRTRRVPGRTGRDSVT